MSSLTRIAVLLATMIACVGCDQVTKSAARLELRTGSSVSLLHDMVRLQHVENPGAFLSMGEALPKSVRLVLFTVGGFALVGAVMFWALRARRLRPQESLGAALICSGGLGNLIDRLTRDGHVTDFLNVGVGSLRTGIFNVADFVLLVGVALLVLAGTAHRPQTAARWRRRPPAPLA